MLSSHAGEVTLYQIPTWGLMLVGDVGLFQSVGFRGNLPYLVVAALASPPPRPQGAGVGPQNVPVLLCWLSVSLCFRLSHPLFMDPDAFPLFFSHTQFLPCCPDSLHQWVRESSYSDILLHPLDFLVFLKLALCPKMWSVSKKFLGLLRRMCIMHGIFCKCLLSPFDLYCSLTLKLLCLVFI
jgi:hypothetical protein